MSNVIEFSAGLVGDGMKIDADQILSHVVGNAETLVVVYEDKDGALQVASTAAPMRSCFWSAQSANSSRVTRIDHEPPLPPPCISHAMGGSNRNDA